MSEHEKPTSIHGPKEERVTPQQLGQIIHDALGISFDGKPVTPLSLDQLKEKGYDEKSIDFSLKAAVLSETMKSMAETLDPNQFIPVTTKWYHRAGVKTYDFQKPKDLEDRFGDLDFTKLRIYLGTLIGDSAKKTWLGPFKQKYPNAFQVLYELHKNEIVSKDASPEKLDLFDAGESGVQIISSFYRFIADRVPIDQRVQTMENSLPALYKMASGNMETTWASELVLGPGLTKGADPEKELQVKQDVRHNLEQLPAEKVEQMRKDYLNGLLEKISGFKNDSSGEFTKALTKLEGVFHGNPDTFLDYLSGLTRVNFEEFPEEVNRFFTYENKDSFYSLERLVETGEETMTPQLEETFFELQRLESITTLEPDFFEVIPVPGPENAQRVWMKEAEPEEGRAQFLLQREPTYDRDKPYENGKPVFTPTDLQKARSKTVGCSAIHAHIAMNRNLEQLADRLNFHPSRINGIAFVTLLTLMAINQFENAKLKQLPQAA